MLTRRFSDSVPNRQTFLRACITTYKLIRTCVELLSMNQTESIRVNVMARDDQTLKISIVLLITTTIAKMKRVIEEEIHEVYGTHFLVSLVEDSKGFVLSNSSAVGDHLSHGDVVFVQSHKEKKGSNMNLPSNLPDLFLTLRYVSNSVLKKLSENGDNMNPLDVLPEILHFGFWYSNIELVGNLCRLLNKLLTSENIEAYSGQFKEIQKLLLFKLLSFWFEEVKETIGSHPEIMNELLLLVGSLSSSKQFSGLLKNHRLAKVIGSLSKETRMDPKANKMLLQIIKNIKGGKSSSLPYLDSLADSRSDSMNIEEVAELLGSGSQQDRTEALQQLSEHPKMMNQLTVRFQHYWKATGLFLMKTIKDRVTARMFSGTVRSLTSHTTREKAVEVMQKDIIRKLHNFLLDSHIESHESVYEFYSLLCKQSASQGMYNVEQGSELLGSPYPKFQRITADNLAEMSEKKISPIRFLPFIKDYIKLALKTEDPCLMAPLMRIVSNLTLDQQCRYQIVNLKGIEVLIKFLEIGSSKQQAELQRACAKGLLNLSISSRQLKAKVLGQLQEVLDHLYKGRLDSVAASYIQTILKATKV